MAGQNKRAVTSYDVAKAAGVSQSAVSRAFTEGAKISPATKEKVRKIAAELGYRPSFIAQSLITRRSTLIGVVVPGLVNPFYAAVLDELSQALNLMGYRVLLFSMYRDDDTTPIMEEILRHRVEALVLVSSSLSSHFAHECQQLGLPVLLLNRKNDSRSVSSVTSDNLAGGAAIADFLLDLGHQQLAFVAGRDTSSTSRDRETGFRQRLEVRGARPMLRDSGMWSIEEAMNATRRLMALPTPPDALFCANDMMAIAALNVVVGEMGMKAGEDISIVGFDDIAMASWPLINLTTWVQPLSEMVDTAIAVLKTQLGAAETSAVQHVLQGKLIVRGSTRPRR
ncbi:TPA: LacI family DNA-binding transcriptional regulator [Klebsiella aerogenes]|uniref:LacI family DNA-binding transcriptional regulator n=1 Tax=Klebsiella aerogenes TaxID=548 RepID=UPI0005EEA282|nr:LacI family DNA-binding transcriptional regulator [Klebsiella aerogenes]EKU0354893.1 LacI family DNA-binding transcriptional regulator [Klebsiella aerogenes]KJO60410.1 LacI family transcriptional regulator [Klebsiella aerogenes]KVI73415.1 LacI family transcriptional regulator [Klebsiella aerogenes]KVI74093.1 LacI family transcriptional regulator [Klebsiella aerogenes]MDH1609941.1 LacI family DNA-binding transcriptional regulator [Klebsiella aerogenes]